MNLLNYGRNLTGSSGALSVIISLKANRHTISYANPTFRDYDCTDNTTLNILNSNFLHNLWLIFLNYHNNVTEKYSQINCQHDCYFSAMLSVCKCIGIAETNKKYPLCSAKQILPCHIK